MSDSVPMPSNPHKVYDGYSRAMRAYKQAYTWSLDTVPPWLLVMLGFPVRGLNPRRPHMKDRARRRRAGYTRTGARRQRRRASAGYGRPGDPARKSG